ncbi:MAG: 4-hydroxythreonine-4-phosphate dehydrogenase PdxA [Deltaproteobacteria bacterium]|nr:4-hydroxythreonine-4-phosphate dehydrogenase PdxA [Deltaproteobacteria bacterium]
MKPRIAITMGDPSGVGPEIILKALGIRRVRESADIRVVGDEGVFARVSKKLSIPFPISVEIISASKINAAAVKPGRPSIEGSKAMIAAIELAVDMAVTGEADAIVTAPISKEAARLAGFKFPGHTEFIAHLTGSDEYAMMLGGESLKVVLVTIHEAIKNVPRLLTVGNILKTIRITDESFKKYFGMKRPRIAVCGLNPHAGEAAMFGDEDERIVAPAVKKALKAGINAIGPLPSDTVFYRAVRKKEFDAVVCMYHDQGLIPLKLLHFEDGVNTTLGLSIIRTSVDHGTAYDIAWKGVARPESMAAAVLSAAAMAGKRKGRR